MSFLRSWMTFWRFLLGWTYCFGLIVHSLSLTQIRFFLSVIPVGAISYMDINGYRYKRDVLFCYDLKLPESFIPKNEGKHLWDKLYSTVGIEHYPGLSFCPLVRELHLWLLKFLQTVRLKVSSWSPWLMSQTSYEGHTCSSQIAA